MGPKHCFSQLESPWRPSPPVKDKQRHDGFWAFQLPRVSTLIGIDSILSLFWRSKPSNFKDLGIPWGGSNFLSYRDVSEKSEPLSLSRHDPHVLVARNWLPSWVWMSIKYQWSIRCKTDYPVESMGRNIYVSWVLQYLLGQLRVSENKHRIIKHPHIHKLQKQTDNDHWS